MIKLEDIKKDAQVRGIQGDEVVRIKGTSVDGVREAGVVESGGGKVRLLKWADEARAYNELIGSWHAIVTASHEVGHSGEQTGLDF